MWKEIRIGSRQVCGAMLAAGTGGMGIQLFQHTRGRERSQEGIDIDTNAGALINGVELSAATHEGQVKSAMSQAIKGKGARSFFGSARLRKSAAIRVIRIPFSFANSRSGTPDTWTGPCKITKERQRRDLTCY
jgi:hypothetical protein